MSNNQLQNEEFYLPGDLGQVKLNNQIHDVKSVFNGNDGTVTMTLQNSNNGQEVNIFKRPKFEFQSYGPIPKQLNQ